MIHRSKAFKVVMALSEAGGKPNASFDDKPSIVTEKRRQTAPDDLTSQIVRVARRAGVPT
jgi:hypothetical protein